MSNFSTPQSTKVTSRAGFAKANAALAEIRQRSTSDRSVTSILEVLDESLLLWAMRGRRLAAYQKRAVKHELPSIVARLRNGTYSPGPCKVKQLVVNKKVRLLHVPTARDRVVQRACVLVLQAIFEPVFYNVNVGGRPGRSVHQALDVLRTGLQRRPRVDLIRLDIKNCFASIAVDDVIGSMRLRVKDRRFLHLIRKMLTAQEPTESKTMLREGMPLAPICANVHFHYVLDGFMVQWMGEHGSSPAAVRWIDDMLILCDRPGMASSYLESIVSHLANHGLFLHPEKSKIVSLPQLDTAGPIEFLGFQLMIDRDMEPPEVRWVTSPDRLAAMIKAARARLKSCPPKHRTRVIQSYTQFLRVDGNELAMKQFLDNVG